MPPSAATARIFPSGLKASAKVPFPFFMGECWAALRAATCVSRVVDHTRTTGSPLPEVASRAADPGVHSEEQPRVRQVKVPADLDHHRGLRRRGALDMNPLLPLVTRDAHQAPLI